MFKSLKRNFFPFIIAFSALSISASAAFYSVSGLSKLFAGAQLEVIIMAGSLEFGKLVIASLLYQYWDSINKWLRTYLTVAAVILVLITSMGIYGFLSAAYQETYQKLIVQQNEIEFLENKSQFYQEDIDRYDEELVRISNNISTLSNSRASSIQVRDTTSSTGFRNTISTTELRLAQSRINVEEENRKAVQAKRQVAADSLQTYKLQILELQNNADTVGELGPLQYLSGLTGTPMDKIINILLLVIIFVFDPLAISMVVAANFAFDMANPKRKEDEETPYDPTLTDDFEDDDDYYDNRGSVYYDEEDDDGLEDILDKVHETTKKPPFDISMNREDAQAWYDIADKIAEESAKLPDEARGFAPPELDEDEIIEEEFGHLADEGLNDLPWEQEPEYLDEADSIDRMMSHDPEIQAFLDAQDEPGPWSEEDDKIHTIGGLTNDKGSGFMDFQKKMDENDEEWDEEHALDQVLNDMVESLDEEDLKELEVNDPEEVSNKIEVENTQGDVTVVDNSDKTETEADRIGTFPNQNNPTSVASIVQKIDTPHLPENESPTPIVIGAKREEKPVIEEQIEEEDIKQDEDELFKAALREKAEKDKQEFLRKNEKDNQA